VQVIAHYWKATAATETGTSPDFTAYILGTITMPFGISDDSALALIMQQAERDKGEQR
jgi:hypothetical protein